MNKVRLQPSSPAPRLTEFRAGVFDLDGVVTHSARLHFASWKRLFDDLLRHGDGARPPPFTESDYRRYVDGKPRLQGIRDFLRARGMELPEGSPEDAPGAHSVHGLGKLKNRYFHEQLQRQGVEVCADTVDCIRRLRQTGVKTALVSSSRNAAAVLAAAGLEGLFDLCIDGAEAARLGLRGKPAPDLFRHAAQALGVDPAQSFAVEDAQSGVAAARAAGFGLVIGIDRGGGRADLQEHGADIVVASLAELAATDALPDALERFAEIENRLKGRRPALFLDYDGTLTPIVDRPELAVLGNDVRGIVQALSRLCTVAVVSGRDRADVERLVGIDTLIYAGSHGFDISGPNGLSMQHEQAAEFLPALDAAETRLRQALAGIEGALVERKRYAIAVHYRLVKPEQVAAVDDAVEAARKAQAGRLRRTGGKMIFELRPQLPWDKGRAVCWLLEVLALDGPEVLPIYLGDDETDEDAFRALGQRGLGILVCAEPTASAAAYRLADTAAAGVFLRKLLSVLQA